MNQILAQIRAELQANATVENRQNAQRFFKEQAVFYGIKTPTVKKIAKKHWQQVKALEKPAIFELCEELLRSDFTEEAFIVNTWLPLYIDCLVPADLKTFRRWIECYINNWAKCDGFCNHTIGDILQKYPKTISEVKSWARSSNRWLKRASAVSLIVPAKKGLFLKEAFEICDVLLVNGDDMVQKGYGWLLKEESRNHQQEVLDYVIAHRAVMPRTALRYAIELMPKELKTRAMNRE
ncbi:MAG: DNA alkylation repair protein [Candidatus Bathyarchaeota archaeon]|nr:DNA alkylation repair protein [Candidatus Bathyarchaeota archaeon]